MSVRKRAWVTKSGERREAWVVNYSDSAGVRRIATFTRKRDADAYDAETRTAVRAGVHTAPSVSPTVAEAAEDWLRYVELEGRERTTVKQYREHVTFHINPRMGRERLAQRQIIQLHELDLISGDGRLGQHLRDGGERAPEAKRHWNQTRFFA